MKLKLLGTKLFAAIMAFAALPLSAQVEVNYEKYPDYVSTTNVDYDLMVRKTTGDKKRPARVNNAETKYFPTIFNQDGGSCGSASRISYMFTYEINALRDADASKSENIYPSHFTWLLTNSGSSKDGMAIANGIPNMEVYGGRTYSALFGNQDCSDPDFGWMQGYDKWYSAMFNRLGSTANFPLSVETEEGREAVKNWIWNHNGDDDFSAGGICGIGVASGGIWRNIPFTDKNLALGVAGQYYVGQWGQQVDHALTIVGYDDEIEFDLDGNGIVGEKDKDEVGAWIIANSWSSGWCNRGFIYCPYKNAVTAVNGSYYAPEVYHIRKNYRPLRTMKIEMEYSKRSELLLSAGISSDINAEVPERVIQFEHFKYAGDGDGDNVDASTPMLGRWKDGIHREPMEFGYDLTDLSAEFDTRKPLKYFFVIQSKMSASGGGKVHNCSVIDYEFDENGIEFPCEIPEGGVKIKTLGGKTYISVVVTGEPLNVPRNLMLADGKLTWDAPALSTYELLGYNVYNGGNVVERLDKDALSFSTEDNSSLSLAAIYKVGDKEAESSKVVPTISSFQGSIPTSNNVHGFQYSGFEIIDLFKEKYTTATIEFWLSPTNCVNYNQQMGPGWGNFLMHTTSSAQLVVGWSTNERIQTKANALSPKQWNHVAIVVNGSTMTAYVNGENVGEVTSSQNGIGGFGNLIVGGTTSSTGINGNMDEFRVWSSARTQAQIQSMMYYEVADPVNTSDLLVNINMNEDENGNLFDVTGKYEVQKLSGRHKTISNNNVLVDKRELTSSFILPNAPYYSNSSISIKNNSSANSVKYLWEADGKQYSVQHPEIVFETVGEKTISLTVFDGFGNSAKSEQKLTVESLPAPVANFMANETATVGERISFINNTTPMDACSFEWSMPGADVESATTVNAAATFSEPGFYTVTLKAKNAAGENEYSKVVTVGNVTPEVDFKVEPSVVLKGATVKVLDQSKYQPTKWMWSVYDNAHHNVYYDQNFEITMNDPGIYTVALEAANHIGTGKGSRANAIVVCNADSKSGLNFRGETTETVTFNNPINLKENKAFTMDWWMNPKKNATSSHAIGGSMYNMLICSLSDGRLSFSISSTVYTSVAKVFIPAEWHHYTIVFDKGALHIYRDTEFVETIYTRVTSNFPDLPSKFTLGGSEGAMNAVIDEYRIWNKALSIETIKEYANAPIDDIKSAEEKHKLMLYYQFNQSSGDVQDATSNANNGVRSGFGPEGDAWSSSLGVFCLSANEREDITADYLTNYKRPFLYSNQSVDPSMKIAMELLQNSEQSTWVVQNHTVSGKVKTGFYVNKNEGDALAITLKSYNFEAEVNNHKLFQTVTLPAGYYVFGFKHLKSSGDEYSYIVVSEGSGLPDTEKLAEEALASAFFDEANVSFMLTKETTVSLGLLMNTRGATEILFDRFYLEKKESNDDFTWAGIEDNKAEDSLVKVNVRGSEVEFCTESARRVTVYSIYGAVVIDEVVNGSMRATLPAGIYIIEGTKFIVR